MTDFVNLNWAEKFIEVKGIQRLCDVGAEVPELKIECSMIITSNTRSLVSALLQIIYDNMYYDAARAKFREAVEEFAKYEKFMQYDNKVL